MRFIESSCLFTCVLCTRAKIFRRLELRQLSCVREAGFVSALPALYLQPFLNLYHILQASLAGVSLTALAAAATWWFTASRRRRRPRIGLPGF